MTIEACKGFKLDTTWIVVISVISGIVVLGLHFIARKRVFGDDFG